MGNTLISWKLFQGEFPTPAPWEQNEECNSKGRFLRALTQQLETKEPGEEGHELRSDL